MSGPGGPGKKHVSLGVINQADYEKPGIHVETGEISREIAESLSSDERNSMASRDLLSNERMNPLVIKAVKDALRKKPPFVILDTYPRREDQIEFAEKRIFPLFSRVRGLPINRSAERCISLSRERLNEERLDDGDDKIRTGHSRWLNVELPVVKILEDKGVEFLKTSYFDYGDGEINQILSQLQLCRKKGALNT